MPRDWALDCIDEQSQRGLEIGPLATPIASKTNGAVFYVDHADTETLRHKYAEDVHMRTRLDEIVEVDYVLPAGQSLAQGLASEGPFDYIIASHIIEHIPDVVTWLDEIHGLLGPGGILSLVVPDKRFTFDVNRVTTDVSAILDAHHLKLVRPAFGHIYDFSSRTIHGVDARKIWSREEDYTGVVRADCPDPDLMAFEFAEKSLASGDFIDIHCHVFTPASFLEVIDKLGHLGLLKYELASFHPTARDDLEFFVSLRALAMPDDSPESRRDRQHRSVASASVLLQEAELPPTGQADDHPLAETRGMQLSDLERRLIAMKRSAMSGIRRSVGALRRDQH
jgi:SAM-dependent methyltransferase